MQHNLLSHMAKNILVITPKVAAKPWVIIPFAVKSKILEQLLQQLFSEQIAEDELGFLTDKWVAIAVPDLQLSFEVTFTNRFMVRPLSTPDVTLSANSHDLLLVAAAMEDPDTLFFQRRLCIEGNTELGLEVKNMLLAIDLEKLPSAAQALLHRLATSLVWLQNAAIPSSPSVPSA
ncbi:ubiquinone anaerobic biosynthesis accessory factor UbiT [Shewanella sp. YIC-542]|uniref:ubiquinone anaerobic biosynthesis accessory factor UbiT n=1 Tax=Shewanella mytili TaxID=3377111 RepID=UPI00398F09BC